MFNIATINVQNKYKLKKYNGIYNGEDHVKMLLDIIKKYDLDIVGLQEVNMRYYGRIKKLLDDKYSLYGQFRFTGFFLTKYIFPFSFINESVPIISCRNCCDYKTKVLPWIMSYVPRIVTMIDVEIDDIGVVTIMNTHIDYMKNTTKIKQIKRIEKIIKKINNPVILMGDFNMTLKNSAFVEFVSSLESMDIKRVDICENTFKNHRSNYSIDHVFISNCFSVKNIILEKDSHYDNFSDHYPIILELDIKSK